MKKLSLFFSLIVFVLHAQSQDLALYQKKTFISGKDTLPYRLLLPENYNSKKAYPLILFLHGAGERGSDNEKQLVHGGKLFLLDSIRQKYPAIVVFPQCMSESYWSNVFFVYDSLGKRTGFQFETEGTPTKAMSLVLKLMKDLRSKYKISKSQSYVGGLSMGGMGTFEIVRRMSDTFAAAFAICGGANPATATQMSTTAWWIFHGLKDNVVDPKYSIDMANALKSAGAEVRLTLYPEANHNSWDSAFSEKDLLPWLWSHHLK